MDWSNLTAIATIISFVISAAAGYLRMFISNKLAEHERNMHEWLQQNYHSRALIDLRFENLDSRLARLEQTADS